MSTPNKPRVLLKCVANHYAATGERIIEFGGDAGSGGLISFRMVNGRLVVNVYRTENTTVKVSKS
jgi:hypothetical protein